jgi:nucleoside-diphosphate-sugar epimerase
MLSEFASKGIPWPLGAFENKRSFCSIDNLLFIIQELIEREDIPSGVYNVADDEPISTNELILLIAQSIGKNPKIYKISKWFVRLMARIGDLFYISFNTERLQKLTSTYLVSNSKIKHAMGKPLPLNSRDGLLKTFKAFK